MTDVGLVTRVAAGAIFAACAVSSCATNDHPDRASECQADVICLGVGGPPGSGGGHDGGTTTDATIDGAEAGVVNIGSGAVRNVTSFTLDPATGVIDTEASLFVRGAQGAKFIDTPVTSGTFTLPALDNTYPVLNYVYLESRATSTPLTRTIYGFNAGASGGSFDVQIPSFPANLSQTWALSLGVPTAGGSTAGTGTVVVQVLDTTGTPIKGVTGSQSPFALGPTGTKDNPYYDDNSDGLVANATLGSGTRGTIVWLGVTPNVFSVTLKLPTGQMVGISPGAQADAVTFLRVAVAL